MTVPNHKNALLIFNKSACKSQFANLRPYNTADL